MIYENLEKKILDFIEDSENPDNNFWLAVEYDNLNQTASAFSLYLRCAERTTDKNLQYECLIRSGLCFKRQGERVYSEKSCWQNAIYIMPHRPEAYFFMSQFFYGQEQFHTALTYICTGEMLAENERNLTPFRIKITKDYGGLFEFKTRRVLISRKCGIDHLPEDLQFMNSIEINQK